MKTDLRTLSALLVTLGFLTTGGALASDSAPTASGSYILQCGAVVDVERERVGGRADIFVMDGKIAQIGSGLSAEGVDIIDLSDQYCMPGLMDMHVHLFVDSTTGTTDDNFLLKSTGMNALQGMKRAQLMLNNGFTTIRIPGDIDYGYAAIDIRNAINRGEYVGPRMFVAAHAVSQTGGHVDLNEIRPDTPFPIPGTVVKAGVDNVREYVRREVKYGSDWIKITASGGVMSQHDDPRVQGFTDEEIQAFADEAHRLNVKITAHVHGNPAGLSAALAGFDSIEHGTMLEDDTIAAMVRNDVVLVPTRYVLEWILEMGARGGITEDNLRKAKIVNAMHETALMKAYKAGVRIAMGSDPIFPHKDAAKEFAEMTRAGISIWDTIRAGTIVSAELVGMEDEIGSIQTGKAADIVAVSENPTDDITTLERVGFVMKGGAVIRNDY